VRSPHKKADERKEGRKEERKKGSRDTRAAQTRRDTNAAMKPRLVAFVLSSFPVATRFLLFSACAVYALRKFLERLATRGVCIAELARPISLLILLIIS